MKSALIAILGIIVLGSLFLLMSPDKTQVKKEASNKALTPTSVTIKSFDLVVENRKLISGPTTLKANQGDEVVINIKVDKDEELHVHGYDKSIGLEKDKMVELKFVADKTGRFSYELEHSKTELGALEVVPN